MSGYDPKRRQYIVHPGDLCYWQLPREIHGHRVVPCRLVAIDPYSGRCTIQLTGRHGDYRPGDTVPGVLAKDVLPRDALIERPGRPPLIARDMHRVEDDQR